MLKQFKVMVAASITILAGCASSADDTPPDCSGGVRVWAALCSPDSAEQQLKMNGCQAYKMFSDENLVAQYKASAKAWVKCVKASTTCDGTNNCAQ